jgi:hypothetical protein
VVNSRFRAAARIAASHFFRHNVRRAAPAEERIANLLLVRVEGRQQKLAVRAALGAGRAQIVAELLLESALAVRKNVIRPA